MRVVVVGATGNVGTSVLEALAPEEQIDEVIAVARRPPTRSYPRTTFVQADITGSDLEPIFRGADAVVHLAWLIQPGRDESVTHAVNVAGSERVFQASVQAGVPAIVYASSVGAYSPGPKDRLVDESWPTQGIRSSFYSRHKAAVERQLDRLEGERPDVRVVRMRPGLIFKREAASEIRRLFAGPLVPRALVHERFIPVVPDVPRLRFQALHSLDAGDAYRRAVISDARGPFNLAAEPVLDPAELARLLHARRVRIPTGALRTAAAAAFALRLTPSEPGWVDLALAVPLLDSARARRELGWKPRRSSTDALSELLEGMRAGGDLDTPPLERGAGGPARIREFLTGLGARQ
ncbi:MAG: NAD-dependent epimerase/dehydratase family protein [Actinomycetota bacterium]|nr:NAD-dependent epimerase/dehydratase family protein [Actinomycetota bacterium]